MSDKNTTQILISSTLATTIVSALTNPLDVIKVRIQNSAKGCVIIDQSQCVGHNHGHNTHNPLRQASLYSLLRTPNIQDDYRIFCDCLPFRSNTKALVYLIKKEGPRTLMNGLFQGLAGSVLATVTYFFCYEGARKRVKKLTSHPVAIPLMTALIARTITTCIAFPFEYWRTLQQSVIGTNEKAGFRLGMKVNAGLVPLLQRDLLFSGLYWVLVENIRRTVKSWRQQQDEGYMDKKNLFLSNLIAGSVSGAISAFVTFPLDVVKTRKQLYPEEYQKRSTYSILKHIYSNEGPGVLIAGMRQRVTKVTVSCAGVLTLYEFFSDVLKESK